MTKRKSSVVGSIACPICVDKIADVRQTEGKNYKFIHCEIHKTINSTSNAYQQFINSNMKPVIEGECTEENPPGQTQDNKSPEPATVEPAENENQESEKMPASGFWPWEN